MGDDCLHTLTCRHLLIPTGVDAESSDLRGGVEGRYDEWKLVIGNEEEVRLVHDPRFEPTILLVNQEQLHARSLDAPRNLVPPAVLAAAPAGIFPRVVFLVVLIPRIVASAARRRRTRAAYTPGRPVRKAVLVP